MSDRFQGDPKVTIGPNGAEMHFMGGQPVMDQGLENSYFISLFTKPGWWGNVLMDEESQKIGSLYEQTAKGPINLNTLTRTRDAALKSVQWAIDEGVASENLAEVTNTKTDRLETTVLAIPPGKDFQVLLATKYGASWIAQKIDPANLKV
jgi:phage gp46-like protein